MSTGSVCVVGSFMMDLVANASRRPAPGETIMGTDFQVLPGGKGFNQAIAASRAESATAFVGRLGEDDFAIAFRDALKLDGIDASMVRADNTHGTGVGLPVVEPDGQNSIIIVPRANLAISAEDIREAAPKIESADVMLLQLEIPLESVLEAAKIARAAETLVILNPAPFTTLSDEILQAADVLAPNETELLALCDGVTTDIAEVRAMAVGLGAHANADVVVTLGSRGVMVIQQGQPPVQIAPHAVTSVDTVGAGDVFCGNLGAALARGLDLVEAAHIANAAAAIAVTRRGGGNSAPRLAQSLELRNGR